MSNKNNDKGQKQNGLTNKKSITRKEAIKKTGKYADTRS